MDFNQGTKQHSPQRSARQGPRSSSNRFSWNQLLPCLLWQWMTSRDAFVSARYSVAVSATSMARLLVLSFLSRIAHYASLGFDAIMLPPKPL